MAPNDVASFTMGPSDLASSCVSGFADALPDQLEARPAYDSPVR